MVSQLYNDNGYTYQPATHCLQWLQTYFSKADKTQLITPKICNHIGKEGLYKMHNYIGPLNLFRTPEVHCIGNHLFSLITDKYQDKKMPGFAFV